MWYLSTSPAETKCVFLFDFFWGFALSGELRSSNFAYQLFYPILSDKREARDLEVNFYEQAEIEIDPKSFGFSKAIWDLQLLLEGFNEIDPDDFFVTEEELKEAAELVLVKINKYFSN